MTSTGLVDATVVHSGGTVALHAATVLAQPGELLVVLGPSGSGKSTLLKAVAGLVEVRSGEVLINGARMTTRPPEGRDTAMVFEYSELVPFLDVSENLALGLKLHHRPQVEIDQRVSTQARKLRLTRLLSRRPATLSAGERGQVGIGRALIRVPSVFLLDEPLAHHDAGSRAQMRRHIVDVVKGLGVTTIYVTHDQSEALAIADRIAILQEGAVVQLAPPRELYAKPATVFIAGFVGSVPLGLLSAQLVSSAGMAGFRVGARVLPLWGPVPDELSDRVGQNLLLGVRAEDVRDATDNAPPDLATLPGVVTRLEYTGADTILTIAIAAPPVSAPGAELADSSAESAQLRARFSGRTAARVGSAVQISVDLARAHVFDMTTGQAVCHLAPSEAS
jgi:multiple sugar transport system ATP-binding protein